MTERPGRDRLDEVRTQLERADEADDETRLEILESLHQALENELDESAEAPPSGR